MEELYFRLARDQHYPAVDTTDFVLIDRPGKVILHAAELALYLGLPGLFKLLIKSLGSSRRFYAIIQNHAIVACGTLTIGFCRYYDVEPDAVVIGSVWTNEALRGQGLATRSLRAAMNSMLDAGRTLFYIDTQENNLPMLKAIEKLGFGEPIGRYPIEVNHP